MRVWPLLFALGCTTPEDIQGQADWVLQIEGVSPQASRLVLSADDRQITPTVSARLTVYLLEMPEGAWLTVQSFDDQGPLQCRRVSPETPSVDLQGAPADCGADLDAEVGDDEDAQTEDAQAKDARVKDANDHRRDR